MSGLPPGLREYLLAPSLQPLWPVLRERLERNGHAVRGSVAVPLDDDGADRLGGLLGRAVGTGGARVRLAELDAALRASAAGRGLVAVVAELTGAPLRNLPAERDAVRAGRQQLWAQLDQLLVKHDLAGGDPAGGDPAGRNWVGPWRLRLAGDRDRPAGLRAGGRSVAVRA